MPQGNLRVAYIPPVGKGACSYHRITVTLNPEADVLLLPGNSGNSPNITKKGQCVWGLCAQKELKMTGSLYYVQTHTLPL